MKSAIVTVILGIITIALPSLAQAEYCPSKIAAIHRDPLADKAAEVMKELYEKLGCDIAIQASTAKRSVLDFNKGKIDGEMLRTRLIEQQYKRDYVRSVQVADLPGVLWVHPDQEMAETLPLGYVRGYSWQETYTSEHDKNNIGFSSDEELFLAWNRGQIGSLLGDHPIVSHYIRKQKLTIVPVEKEVVSNAPLFHYLSYEYAPFMAAFSNAIERNNPFPDLLE